MDFKVVAPCGIDCFNCPLYDTNVTEDFRDYISKTYGIPEEKVTCMGCKDGNQCLFLDLEGKQCKTLECIKEKGVDYCFQCDTFPCAFLMPLADGADRFPQNIKLYNLCMMKRIGVEAWTEKAAAIRHTYFNHKIKIGEGGSR